MPRPAKSPFLTITPCTFLFEDHRDPTSTPIRLSRLLTTYIIFGPIYTSTPLFMRTGRPILMSIESSCPRTIMSTKTAVTRFYTFTLISGLEPTQILFPIEATKT